MAGSVDFWRGAVAINVEGLPAVQRVVAPEETLAQFGDFMRERVWESYRAKSKGGVLLVQGKATQMLYERLGLREGVVANV